MTRATGAVCHDPARKWVLRRRLLPRRPTQRPRWPSPRPMRLDTSASSACRCAADSTRTSTCPPPVGIAQKPFPKALKDGRVTSFSLCSLRSTYHMRSESTFRQSSVRDGVSPKDRRPLYLCTYTTAFSKWPSCSHAYLLTTQWLTHTHTLACCSQTFSATAKRQQLEKHISTKHDDKKNKATFDECFGADCTAKA